MATNATASPAQEQGRMRRVLERLTEAVETFLAQQEEIMKRVSEQLIEVVENMSTLLIHRIELEDEEREAELALLGKKCELLQRKFEELLAISEVKVGVLDISMNRLEAIFRKRAKRPHADMDCSEILSGASRRNRTRMNGAGRTNCIGQGNNATSEAGPSVSG